ncbi:hypothetical protein [Phenylobacterium sp.]|uniref:hypothetical protein n=1 Tax=Phenylobacterium sp. TaxID=1871053 RepID=UPI004036530B
MADLLDRRQRLAAALCLAAIDLPANAVAAGRQLMQAASVCPGVTMDEIPTNSRREALTKARDILNELISEASAP